MLDKKPTRSIRLKKSNANGKTNARADDNTNFLSSIKQAINEKQYFQIHRPHVADQIQHGEIAALNDVLLFHPLTYHW